MRVLGIETSCDETSAAVVADGKILSNVVSSQIELHKPYGGVVPEIASRNHLQLIDAVIADALNRANLRAQDIEAVAATCGPGLASSLLVGLTTGKGFAFALGVPFIGINHLEAHLFSPFLQVEGEVCPRSAMTSRPTRIREPFIALIVSGGHTILAFVRDVNDYEILGQTVDDAAGEAFDKVAKLLGLGYPGGPEIDRLARNGNPRAVDFPRSMLHDPSFDFSFSGLKTSVRYLVQGIPVAATASERTRGASKRESVERLEAPNPKSKAKSARREAIQNLPLPDLCASFQEAVVDVLVGKTIRAAREKKAKLVTASGGVACNSRFREKLAAACKTEKLELLVAEPRFCTDNAAMIAFLAEQKLARGQRSDFSLDVNPSLAL